MTARPLIAALLALYTVIVTSGAPLPIATVVGWSLPTPSESVEERFPCEGCPCGCGTAEHCWNDCCCHTLPQRLAWAKREGVRPPESALDTAERAGLDIRSWRAGSKHRFQPPSTVMANAKSAGAKSVDPDDLPPCCRKRMLATCGKATPVERSDEEPPQPADPGVSLLQSMACAGLAEAWLALGEAPPVPPIEAVPSDALTVVAVLTPLVLCRAADAPTPPPPEWRPAA